MHEKSRVIACTFVVAALFTLSGIGQATTQGLPHSTSHLRTVEYADLEKYGCGYVVTYDKSHVKYIAVKTILVYKDGHEQVNYIPRVFHNNKDAKGECGAWEDEVEKILYLGK